MRIHGAVLALTVGGCLPELVEIDGEHILYEHSPEFRVCGGTVAYLDEFIPWFAAGLGLPTPGTIRFSWLSAADNEALLGRIASERSDFAFGYHAISESEPAHVHELAHALWGPTPTASFLAEGFATAVAILASNVPLFLQFSEDEVWRAMVAGRHELDYNVAGLFTLFLMARHGPGKFAQLYVAVDPPYTTGEFAAEFRAIYGVELGDEIHRFAGKLDCAGDEFEITALRCTGAEIPWREDVWSFAGSMACDSPDVIGGSMPQSGSTRFRVATVEVPRGGVYTFEADDDDEVFASIMPCFGCPWGAPYITTSPGLRNPLAAGRYQVRVEARGDEDTSLFGVALRPAASVME